MSETNPLPFALIVVDVQQGFDDSVHWGPRNNPDCESNIAVLIEAWREHRQPVVFVRHDSTEPDSPLRPGTPGNAFQPYLTGTPDSPAEMMRKNPQVSACFAITPDMLGLCGGLESTGSGAEGKQVL